MRPGQVPSVSSRNKTLAIAVKNYAKADMTLFFFYNFILLPSRPSYVIKFDERRT